MEHDQDSDPDPDSDLSDSRPSPIAGTWYSGNSRELSREINNYINHADVPPLSGRAVLGLIAPHAGYLYSGETLGYAFRCVKDKQYELVVILSPYHAFHSADYLSSGHAAYETPLGRVPVERNLIDQLSARFQEESGHSIEFLRNDREHSLEIELPFLQTALKDGFSILPLMVRDHNLTTLKLFATCLAEVIEGKDCLIIASTDLSHFFNESQAKKLDQNMMSRFEHFDPEGVLLLEAKGEGFACGAAAVATAMWTTKILGAKYVRNLHYTTSAGKTGDKHSVVGYGASVILK